MTVMQALASATAGGLDRLDAQLLLLHALGRRPQERAWLLVHDAEPLAAADAQAFQQLWARRAAGEPLAYIVGRKEFFGLDLQVDARVLIPRPDTETLVDWALELLDPVRAELVEAPRIVDLGTGSGAIALAIKQHCPQAVVEAVDASPGALEVAAANAQSLALDVRFRLASWLAGTASRYDLIVSNPPYIAESDPHLPALQHEPRAALAAGVDGLDDIRSIVQQAPDHLAPGGWLLLEHGWDQAGAVRTLLQAAGFSAVASRKDLAGIERCSGGQRLELG